MLYVLDYSERHGKIVKFRVDRIAKAEMTELSALTMLTDFDPVSYLKNIIAMYDGRMEKVRLKCEADIMKVIIERFGVDVHTESFDDGFIAEVNVLPVFTSKSRIKQKPLINKSRKSRI